MSVDSTSGVAFRFHQLRALDHSTESGLEGLLKGRKRVSKAAIKY
jgi:hypothetical protein